MPSNNQSGIPSRRQFIALLGAGAMAAVAGCQTADHPVITAATIGPEPAILPAKPAAKMVVNQNAAPAVTTPARTSTAVHAAGPAGIIPRNVWADAGPISWKLIPMAGVQRITFHHSGDSPAFSGNTMAQTIEHLEKIREYHLSEHFADIGYHFAIDRMGRVWQLRSPRYQGEHVKNQNKHNLAIVVLGNFELQQMTAQQKERVRTFGAMVRKYYDLPISQVFTHQEIGSSLCPGKAMQPYMEYVRNAGLI